MSNRNYSYYNNLFGILEGKRKAKIEDEKRKTLQLEADLKLSTADVDATERNSNLLALSEGNKIYYALGAALVFVVLIVMYFKFGRK
jgi:hypothetical protein